MRANQTIKEQLGIDLDNDPEGIDKLITHIGETNDRLADSSEENSSSEEAPA